MGPDRGGRPDLQGWRVYREPAEPCPMTNLCG